MGSPDRLQIDRNGAIESIFGIGNRISDGSLDSGVVESDVQSAKFLYCLSDQRFHFRGPRDIGLDKESVAASRANRIHSLFAFDFATAGDRHVIWDVPVSVQPGMTAHLELSNINGTGLNANRP